MKGGKDAQIRATNHWSKAWRKKIITGGCGHNVESATESVAAHGTEVQAVTKAKTTNGGTKSTLPESSYS